MANTKKLIQAAAGAAGGEALNVEEVFSTYLYTGNGSTQTITNGIDLSGEGGLLWIKSRTDAYNHYLHDTTTSEPWHFLQSNLTDARNTNVANQDLTISAFNSDGFVVGSASGVNNGWGGNGSDFASWTFRKAPKFFDVVTYTGTGSAQNISHNLGSKPNFYVVKQTSGSGGSWYGYHAGLDSTYTNPSGIRLDSTSAAFEANSSLWNLTFPTSTTFTVGTSTGVNASGETYVAYLFAHNDGDGEFGPTADQDIIKCGSYTGNGSSTGPEIDLGFEPQWVLQKRADLTGNWRIFDNMRGLAVGGNDAQLFPNNSDAEASSEMISLTPTGFQLTTTTGNLNASGATYIYIAIRRGPMAVPESATDVFAIDTRGSSSGEPGFKSGFVIDTFIDKIADSGTSGFAMSSRLTQGKFLQTNSTSAEGTQSSYQFDYMNGFGTSTGTNADLYGWMWRRAPNYFDVVAEPIASAQMSGPAAYSYNPPHNLGVTPEMIWVKDRDNSDNWYVYHSALGTSQKLILNSTAAASSSSWAVASDNFNFYAFGNSTGNAICYLFASLDGVSKVGSYTGDGTTDGSKVIDCGFSAGARFVVIKKTSEAGNWITYDTERGIVSGNDSHLYLDQTSAEDTSFDSITPNNSGFAVNHIASNKSGVSYIFYAIA